MLRLAREGRGTACCEGACGATHVWRLYSMACALRRFGCHVLRQALNTHPEPRHSPPYALRPAPYALRPTPCALRPAPCSLRGKRLTTGLVHFICVDTELLIDVEKDGSVSMEESKQERARRRKRQLAWLRADLQQAATAAAREQHPWIVAFGHRPVFCSLDKRDCRDDAIPLQRGLGRSQTLNPQPSSTLDPRA
jgi:hypothetical protein